MDSKAMCLLFALGLGACGSAPPAPTAAQLVSRGEYLVTRVAGCNDCHTPMTDKGPDMKQSLHGSALVFEPKVDMPWADTAPQIAGGPANFSHDQFVSFLQTGVRPDGTHPRPPMPPYRLNEADARAVAAYVESLPRRKP